MRVVSNADSSTGRLLRADAAPAYATDPIAPEVEVLRLFDQHGHRLLRYVGRFGLEPPDTEDIVQDVFLSLFRHVRLGRSRTNLRGWLFRVAHNLALKHRRRLRRNGPRGETSGAGVAIDAPDPSNNPEEQLVGLQRQARLLAVMHALPERDRRCLQLRAEGLRYREIAHVMGLSLGSVAKSLTRSLAKLNIVDGR